MNSLISVKNLIKRYRDAKVNAVDDISFTVEKGSFFSLLGPNGAGKTTTISILTTILSKTSGTVEIAGFDLDKDQSEVRRNIGIIFQNPSLDMNLSAEENVRLHAILYGLYSFRPTFSLMPASYKKKVKELADILGISKEIFKPVRTFSGGMKRKLEIVRSLIHSPKVLFLDEPTAGLDPLSRKNLWEYLGEMLKNEQVTIFLTTHYLDEAEAADKICIIDSGKIVALGTPREIKSKLVEEYLLLTPQDGKSLEQELKRLKISYQNEGEFKINLTKKTAQEVIHQITSKLTTIKVHTPTLEEAYVEIISKENHEV